ncbi:MAG: phage holin family protein [Bacteroidales bacterium]|nr:phage holin family protein [Bacteroidales bacterium]
MKEEEKSDDKYKSLVKDAKEYIELQSDLIRLNLVEKLSQIISYFAVILIVVVLAMAAFVYCSVAFVIWMKSFLGSYLYGFLILGGFFILLTLILLACRKKLFINPIIKKLSSILFSDSKDEDNEQ